MFVLLGRAEVEVGPQYLVAIERAGPFFWRRKRPLADVRELVVQKPSDSRYQSMAGIQAKLNTGKTFPLCLAYPITMLSPLAEVIADRCELGDPGPALGLRCSGDPGA